MDENRATAMMSALAQPTRLAVFRALVHRLPDAAAAGDIANSVGSLPSTMSAHLAILQRAGLVTSSRDGKRILYAASPDAMPGLARFLLEDVGGTR